MPRLHNSKSEVNPRITPQSPQHAITKEKRRSVYSDEEDYEEMVAAGRKFSDDNDGVYRDDDNDDVAEWPETDKERGYRNLKVPFYQDSEGKTLSGFMLSKKVSDELICMRSEATDHAPKRISSYHKTYFRFLCEKWQPKSRFAVRPRQSEIAKSTGLSLSQVQRVSTDWKSSGMLVVVTRYHGGSEQLRINERVFARMIRESKAIMHNLERKGRSALELDSATAEDFGTRMRKTQTGRSYRRSTNQTYRRSTAKRPENVMKFVKKDIRKLLTNV